MGIITLITFLLCFVGVRFDFRKEGLHRDYLSVPCADSVKGIFVLMVLNGHMSQFVTLENGLLDAPYILVDNWIAQCIVAPFLFCSGYGILCSFMSKGRITYIKTMPHKRMLPTLLHFDIALVLFLVMNLCLGRRYSFAEYVTALVGWNSVGNSTWFVFATLCLYVITYFAGLLVSRISAPNRQRDCFAALIMAGTLAYIIAMMNFKQAVYYNTVLCFPMGVLFARFKGHIDRWMGKLPIWAGTIVALAGSYLLLLMYGNYYCRAPVFALLVFVLTMRFRICNPILRWLGHHVFEVYILQRIPQIVFAHFGLNSNQYIFALMCVPVTILGAWGYKKVTKWLDQKLGISKCSAVAVN